MSKKDQFLFHEVQYVRQFKLIFILLLGWLIWMFVIAGFMFYDLILKPEQIDWTETLIGFTAMGFGIILLIHLCFFTRMITEVTPKGLFVRFIPFHFRMKEIDLKKVVSLEAKQYRPIREYGGWGIRVGWKKKVYNVFGKEGVEMVYKEGNKLLIGSQRAEELAKAIQSILKK